MLKVRNISHFVNENKIFAVIMYNKSKIDKDKDVPAFNNMYPLMLHCKYM